MLSDRDGVREVQTELDEYAAALDRCLRVESFVVTGSRARNCHMRISDIDLLVVSPDFEGMPRLDRIDLLLEPWHGNHALEPLGFTPAEVLDAQGIYLWDALADGRVLRDRGPWQAAVAAFHQRIERGELARRGRGWRFAIPT